MYHPIVPLVVLSFLSQSHSRFIEPGVVPTNLIHHQRRAIDQSVLQANGQEAQKLNAKFSSMDANSPCKTGDSACIAGGFSQCVGGKYVGGPCAQGLKCFALPLLLKKGTSLGCDTEADATSRISNTGATGGLTGNDESGKTTTSASTDAKPTGDKSVNGTQSGSTGNNDDSTGSTANTAADMNNSTSMDSSTGFTDPSDTSDSGTAGETKDSTPIDSSSGASDSSDPSASGADKKSKKSSDSSDSKKDSSKPLEASKNSTSSSNGNESKPKDSQSNSTADKKKEAPSKGSDGEDVEDLSFVKVEPEEKDCKDEA
ncbi:hypothetical protein MJO28_010934 [Puccinia striiformis f. sp. tritici]|uniref:Carbohydrate-binding module family 19 domain-containing protein n=4 Tax=Puccinia striiformis TaxID=27350 RepID=A0A0L0V6U9_9BASI|nr:hypothetical protein Pst134EA_019745 [Puccinia striiformis f. sp. tritici]KAI9619066.1 hypothetical protein KEM48_006423 [Puccinia striiformis f. sp. tritici PST-130]KNE94988.1 hypothetical protein PSTG_11686 [Puccinia striiformis f. sp. tritici PST-78]POW06692.1 hypothetical protein PSTT_08798 [Puccinia striiformis]KAH9449853.1 hypothetical protein Pst134EB_020662 [Puccinia striiformis f. sp. tritici]KAH9459605.1 hypothetical protein Pst134EA_019745 [Puccinia striiformis f. sp. tritici]